MASVSARIVRADRSAVTRAARTLREGGLVAFPTETVYGLGADASNPNAIARIFEAKRRPSDHPLIVHVGDIDAAHRWATLSAQAIVLANAFWPGPLTLIVPRAAHVDDVVTGGQSSVGLRVPSHPVAHALLKEFGSGIAAPSANRFGHVSPTTARHVADDLGDAVDLILDGGASGIGIESTIIALTTDTPMLLRPGGIAADAIEAALGCPLAQPDSSAPRASGTLASHYAPRTPAKLLPRSELLAALAGLGGSNAHISVLAHSVAQPPEFEGAWFDAPGESARYAQQLYANLRALDAREADEIWIEAPPDGPDWVAIGDRLRRATHRD